MLVGELGGCHLLGGIGAFLEGFGEGVVVVVELLAQLEDLKGGLEVRELEHGGVVEGHVLRVGSLADGIHEVAVHVEDLHPDATGAGGAVVLDEDWLVGEAEGDWMLAGFASGE